ncbi:hypothetical protein JCM1841_003587 [Sporobolomyces salmonicolor]
MNTAQHAYGTAQPMPSSPRRVVQTPVPAFTAGGASAPRPQLSTYTPSAGPPQIQVQLHSAADQHPTFVDSPTSPSHSAPLPQYSGPPAGQDWRTAAEQEKDDYYTRSGSSDGGHWADASPAPPSYGGHGARSPPVKGSKPIPAPILLPPKAAFVHAHSPIHSPVSLKNAVAFGDAGSIRGEKGDVVMIEGGHGGADVRKSGLDWNRFSRMVKEKEKEKESDWLRKKQGLSRKWFYLGWLGTILVLVAIAVGVYFGVTHRSNGDTEPSIPSLGGLNTKEVAPYNSTSSSNPVISTTVPSLASSSSSLAALTQAAAVSTTETTTTTSEAAETSVAATTTATPSRRAAATTTSTRSTTTSSARPISSSSSSVAAHGKATETTAANRRRFLQAPAYHEWTEVEWTHYEGVSKRDLEQHQQRKKRSAPHRLE